MKKRMVSYFICTALLAASPGRAALSEVLGNGADDVKASEQEEVRESLRGNAEEQETEETDPGGAKTGREGDIKAEQGSGGMPETGGEEAAERESGDTPAKSGTPETGHGETAESGTPETDHGETAEQGSGDMSAENGVTETGREEAGQESGDTSDKSGTAEAGSEEAEQGNGGTSDERGTAEAEEGSGEMSDGTEEAGHGEAAEAEAEDGGTSGESGAPESQETTRENQETPEESRAEEAVSGGKEAAERGDGDTSGQGGAAEAGEAEQGSGGTSAESGIAEPDRGEAVETPQENSNTPDESGTGKPEAESGGDSDRGESEGPGQEKDESGGETAAAEPDGGKSSMPGQIEAGGSGGEDSGTSGQYKAEEAGELIRSGVSAQTTHSAKLPGLLYPTVHFPVILPGIPALSATVKPMEAKDREAPDDAEENPAPVGEAPEPEDAELPEGTSETPEPSDIPQESEASGRESEAVSDFGDKSEEEITAASDNLPPILIQNLRSFSANRTSVVPAVSVAKEASGKGLVSIALETPGGETLPLECIQEDAGAYIRYQIPEISGDGQYALKVERSDGEGNTVSERMVFSVNQQGTTFIYDGEKSDVAARERYEPEVYLDNVDEIAVVSCTVNGRETRYEMDGAILRIPEEELSRGRNEIAVSVRDAAGNLSAMEPWEIYINGEQTEKETENTASGGVFKQAGALYPEALKRILNAR